LGGGASAATSLSSSRALIYGDDRGYRNVSIAELKDGQAIRVTDYWGESFTPPAWRQALAEPLDMSHNGVWPAVATLTQG
jgi:hypothetical protein